MRKLKLTQTALAGWHDVVVEAQKASQILLPEDAEHYLVSLLLRYTDQPQFVNNIIGRLCLESLQQKPKKQQQSLRVVGDQCLLFAGLFPDIATRRQVSVDYYLDIGKGAYQQISGLERTVAAELYQELAIHFHCMASILQTLRHLSDEDKPTNPNLEAIWQNLDSSLNQH